MAALGVGLHDSPIANSELAMGDFFFGRSLKSFLLRDRINQTLYEFGVANLEDVSLSWSLIFVTKEPNF